MSAPVSLDLARTLAAHSAVAARAARAEAVGDLAAVDRLAAPEGDALAALAAALAGVGSPGDVEAVVEHARDQGGRCAVTELVLLRGLAAQLARRLGAPPRPDGFRRSLRRNRGGALPGSGGALA